MNGSAPGNSDGTLGVKTIFYEIKSHLLLLAIQRLKLD